MTRIIEGFMKFRDKVLPEKEALIRKLANGQSPQALFITCSDSRLNPNLLTQTEPGDLFIIRNAGNIVPPPGGAPTGETATIEYAVKVLNIDHLIVMGHFGCGGVAGCLDMLSHRDGAPDPESFVGKWLTILEPGYDRVAAQGLDRIAGLRAMEHQAILVSLENLMTFPFVSERVAEGKLFLHGIWKDISDGGLEYYDAERNVFVPV